MRGPVRWERHGASLNVSFHPGLEWLGGGECVIASIYGRSYLPFLSQLSDAPAQVSEQLSKHESLVVSLNPSSSSLASCVPSPSPKPPHAPPPISPFIPYLFLARKQTNTKQTKPPCITAAASSCVMRASRRTQGALPSPPPPLLSSPLRLEEKHKDSRPRLQPSRHASRGDTGKVASADLTSCSPPGSLLTHPQQLE